jgi:hypothetical protein
MASGRDIPEDTILTTPGEYHEDMAEAHRQGFEDALRLYGQYDNGVQRIGAMAHTIADCLADYDSGQLDPLMNKPGTSS